MNVGTSGSGARKRRTWYRRRLRTQRTLIAVVVGTLIAGAGWQNAARYFSLPSWHGSQVLPPSFWVRADIHKDLAFAAAHSAKPGKSRARIAGVYPYSIVPGGLKDPADLRYAALRDYVVRGHYAHFDYSHARLVQATEAREVYLSYRIRDSVFWTRRRVRLHVGELLLTDGKITARARCGNQVSDAAKPEVSNEEPAEEVLDQPVEAVESAPSMPARPVLAQFNFPTGQPLTPPLFLGPFFFPYIPITVPLPPRGCFDGDHDGDGHCRHKRKPAPVPEPSTMVLIGSGLGLILWRYGKTARPTVA